MQKALPKHMLLSRMLAKDRQAVNNRWQMGRVQRSMRSTAQKSVWCRGGHQAALGKSRKTYLCSQTSTDLSLDDSQNHRAQLSTVPSLTACCKCQIKVYRASRYHHDRQQKLAVIPVSVLPFSSSVDMASQCFTTLCIRLVDPLHCVF